MRRGWLACALALGLVAIGLAGGSCGVDPPAEYFCSAERPGCPPGFECDGERCVRTGTVDAAQPDGAPAPDTGPGPDLSLPDIPVDAPVDVAPWPDGPLSDGPPSDGPLSDGPLSDSSDAALDGALADSDGPGGDGALDGGGDFGCVPGTLQSCYTGPADTLGVGECKGGTSECSDGGTWGPCVGEVLPQAEACDGKDNDCDGEIDEGCKCLTSDVQSCGSNVGECQQGYQVCDETGNWGTCVGEVKPSPEQCDSLDHDCDGDPYNGMCEPSSTTGCTLSCNAKGTRTCSANCTWGSCVPNSPSYCDPKTACPKPCTGPICIFPTVPGYACTSTCTWSIKCECVTIPKHCLDSS